MISGRVASVTATEAVLENTSFIPGDFTEDQGRVTVPLDPRPRLVRGIGDAILLDDYLSGLPEDLADRIRRAYFPKSPTPSDYVEQRLELNQEIAQEAEGSSHWVSHAGNAEGNFVHSVCGIPMA